MKSYSYSEARGNFATVLDEAERDGAVEIRRRDGTVFRILPLRTSAASPLDVKGVKVKVSSGDLGGHRAQGARARIDGCRSQEW
jgi:antitoxin Phd